MSDEKDDKWEMPKPVFRTTSGALPKSFEETISQSFMPNAETLEIDEDDDILSIMDTPSIIQETEYPDGEKTIEIETDITLETDADASEDASTEVAEHKPIAVTAKDPVEKAASNSGGPKSNLFIYVLIVLIVAVIIAAVVYYQS